MNTLFDQDAHAAASDRDACADHDTWLEALYLRERAKGLRHVTEAADKVWAELFPTRVCSNREPRPGFFTMCCPCACSAEVREDLKHDPYAYASDDVIEPPLPEPEVA